MTLTISGTWVKGMGLAEKFLSHAHYVKQFQQILGFTPFPGTLNLEVSKEKFEEIKARAENQYIFGFKENEKEFGGVNCFPCKVNGIQGAVILPDKSTHPENIMEVISSEALVAKFKLKVGDTVTVEIEE